MVSFFIFIHVIFQYFLTIEVEPKEQELIDLLTITAKHGNEDVTFKKDEFQKGYFVTAIEYNLQETISKITLKAEGYKLTMPIEDYKIIAETETEKNTKKAVFEKIEMVNIICFLKSGYVQTLKFKIVL